MSDFHLGITPSNKTVIPFYATGALAFFILAILLVFSYESLTGHYFSPHLLTIVHTCALGWGTMIIFGAAHQLLPVICETNLYSERLAIATWLLLVPGTAFLAYSFWNFTVGWLMIGGGTMVMLSAILYAVNVAGTSGLREWNIQKVFLVSSAFWLLFTVAVGLLLAINLAYPFFKSNHLTIMKLHAHLGFAGWFLQLITGVSSKLVPMFLLGKSTKAYLLRYAFYFQNTGLILFLVIGYYFDFSVYVLFSALIVFVGVSFWLLYLYDTYKNRIRKKIDEHMQHTSLSIFALVLAFATMPIVYALKDARWTMLYGTFVFMGWISGIILGKTFKTLPFIIWNSHYKEIHGKTKLPLPKGLYNERLLPVQKWIFIAALILQSLGIILQIGIILWLAAIAWLIVAGLYGYNVITVLTHKPSTMS